MEKYKDNDIRYKLLNDKEYFRLNRKVKKIYSLTKIVLPPLPSENHMHEKIRKDMEQVLTNNLGEDVNLEDANVRIAIKKFLLGECYGVCPCCGKHMTMDDITIDHIVAKSKKGKNNIQNFIGLCEKCNKEKDADSILSVLSRREFKFLPVRVLLIAYSEQEKLKDSLIFYEKELNNYIKNNY